jgi:hypothetical protein
MNWGRCGNMSNMSYCRFQNTLSDLEDCFENMGDNVEKLSISEARCRKQIIELAKDIIDDFGHEVGY